VLGWDKKREDKGEPTKQNASQLSGKKEKVNKIEKKRTQKCERREEWIRKGN